MITLELRYRVEPDKYEDFEAAIKDVFVPAVSRQDGFQGYVFLREFDNAALDKMEVPRDPYAFRLNLSFESEEQRLKWAATREHDHAVAVALGVAEDLVVCGFDVVSSS